MDMNAVIEEVAAQLGTIAGLRVHPEPPGTISPPAAVVTFPEISFDATYGRGMDRFELPVVLLVGKASDRAARKAITPYISGSGSKSLKTVIEAGTYTAFHTVRVSGAVPDVIAIGAVEYLAYTFTLDIAGQGA